MLCLKQFWRSAVSIFECSTRANIGQYALSFTYFTREKFGADNLTIDLYYLSHKKTLQYP